MKVCPKCGGKSFFAHRIYHVDVLITGEGQWIEDRGVYDASLPFEPFTCKNCGAEYEKLQELRDE